ncbi:MAG: nucleotide kinase [Methanomicrobiales archaeon]|nr:nucleotide kinase [Methanomicrobiales archaeon]
MNKDISAISGQRSPLFIITGEQGEGKTTYLKQILDKLSNEDIRISGIVAPGYFQGSLRSGFDLIDIYTGMSEELCSVVPTHDSELHGRYYFRNSGISFGCNAILNPIKEGTPDLVVIDEVGRFELNGVMWAGCIDLLYEMNHPPMIWTVRSCFVDDVLKRWPYPKSVIVDIDSVPQSEVIPEILNEIREFRSILPIKCK